MKDFLPVDSVHVHRCVGGNQGRTLSGADVNLPEVLGVGVDFVERMRGVLHDSGPLGTSPLGPIGAGGKAGCGERGDESELGGNFHTQPHCTVCAAEWVQGRDGLVLGELAKNKTAIFAWGHFERCAEGRGERATGHNGPEQAGDEGSAVFQQHGVGEPGGNLFNVMRDEHE